MWVERADSKTRRKKKRCKNRRECNLKRLISSQAVWISSLRTCSSQLGPHYAQLTFLILPFILSTRLLFLFPPFLLFLFLISPLSFFFYFFHFLKEIKSMTHGLFRVVLFVEYKTIRRLDNPPEHDLEFSLQVINYFLFNLELQDQMKI